MEEWITQQEYMKRYSMGYAGIKQLIASGQVECKKYGNRVKIKVGGNSVSKELYEQEKEKRIKAEQTIELLKKILVEVK